MSRRICRTLLVLTLLSATALTMPAGRAYAQGVTTSGITGVVTDSQGAVVPGATVTAVHEPSGTTYTGVTQGDGRVQIPGMRVGGPYTVTAELSGFQNSVRSNVLLSLGVTQDLEFAMALAGVSESVDVVATADPVFSSSRTGAATSVSRDELAVLPTLNGRISDITRLTPQASGSGSFGGNDNRMNNITIDGSSFNNSFGLGGQPGDRTSVAPISLEAMEQIQVNVAPFDVRQGSFIGAGVNAVTRSGTNRLVGSFYHRFRNQDWVGTEASGQTVNPGTFTFRNTGGWAGGPIVRNKLFAFGNFEDQLDKRPLTTFRSNDGGPPSGQITRVKTSDMSAVSAFLSSKFNYDTGVFNDIPDETPARRFLVRSDYNVNDTNKVSFRYNYLDSKTDTLMSNSTGALQGRSGNSASYLNFQNTNYQIKEKIYSGIGEWNSVIGATNANTLQIGYTFQDEGRSVRNSAIFPFVDIYEGGTSYMSFGYEPFTVDNALSYKTFQLQDNFTRFISDKHTLTLGVYLEKYHSDNVFFGCCPHGAWSYNSLPDFFTDANDALANPGRTTSPVAARAFQIRWSNIPGQEKPDQPLDVWYYAGYAQDEWRPRRNVTVTAGVRFDVSSFGDTGYQNAAADALTFRGNDGQPIQFQTGSLPDTKILWSPRVGMNWDVFGDQSTQIRGGTGLFSGRPAYVWISNQIGNTGVLIGERIVLAPGNAFPFTEDPSRYAGVATGINASSYQLNLTDANFKFPQVWRTNGALDRKLPLGIVSTTEFIYTKDVNGVYYYNANLPAAQSTFAGVDNRPRWTGAACASAGQVGPCINRINNATGNQVTANYVLKNGSDGSAWSFAESLSKTMGGMSVRGAYSYGVSRTISDPESTAATSFGRNTTSGDPNDSGAQDSLWSPGHRVYAMVNYTKQYLRFGATTFSVFWEAKHSLSLINSSRVSYVFSGDMNSDGVANNDLIYIPANTSEMNFQTFTASGRTYTAEEQAGAFEAFIQQDDYLRSNRGKYAQRNGGVMPMFNRMDFSVMQDLFKNLGRAKHSLQVRLDIQNFGNLLNDNWGVMWRPVASINSNQQMQVLTDPGVDAQGRSTYRLARVGTNLIKDTYQTSAQTDDVYQFMVTLRYGFN